MTQILKKKFFGQIWAKKGPKWGFLDFFLKIVLLHILPY